MDFFLKDEDQRLAEQATGMDDIDIILSPIDGAMVVVAMKKGVHVCQICTKDDYVGIFDETDPKLKSTEVKMGGTRMKLHALCAANGSPHPYKFFMNKVRGMQIRRKLAAAARNSEALTDISEQNKDKVVA